MIPAVATQANSLSSASFVFGNMPVRGSDHAQSPSIRRHSRLVLQTCCRETTSVLGVGNLIFKLSGSIPGGVPETQQMLDYCARHNITADVKIIPSRKINEAFEYLLTPDADYRFVTDMNTAGLRSRQLSGASL